MLENLKNYKMYADFVTNPKEFTVDVNSIDFNNWDDHFNGILNILKDGIELDWVQSTFIKVDFGNNRVIELSITDYFFNIIMWYLIIRANCKIEPKHLFFEEAITRKAIKKYIDKFFIEINRKKLSNIELNNIINDTLYQYSKIDIFYAYLANTINLEDTIKLMKASKEFNDIIHADLSNVPLEDVREAGQKLTSRSIEIMKNSRNLIGYDHCLTDSWRAKEGINEKQYKEFAINIGSKPNGLGGVYPVIINKSFITGGVNDLMSYLIESSTGRIAQILSKNNVGDSGHFARLLKLNNTDIFLHDDPNYVCDTKNYQHIYITRESLKMFRDRYYRFEPNGLEYIIKEDHTFLIGKTILLRSPMTCASKSRGEGVCYRCYGDLAYTNNDINIGVIGAEEISSKLTQILLSAKHLLETFIKKIVWRDNFFNYFDIDGNIIKLSSELNLKNTYLIISRDELENNDFGYSKYDDEEDLSNLESCEDSDDSYFGENHCEYIQSFQVKVGAKDPIDMGSLTDDKLYLSVEINEVIRRKGEAVDGDKIYVPMSELEDLPLFFIDIQNNELSKTMDKLMNIINKNDVTTTKNRHELLDEFVNTILEGNLDVMAVHCEIILSNQIRNIDNVLEMPDWSYPNEPYKLLTLNQALTDNPSVVVSLLYQKLSKMLYNPLTFRKNKPSFLDLFFMEKPQKYLTDRTNIQPAVKPTDVENNLKPLIIKYEKTSEE